MTHDILSAIPLMVALVQGATTLPIVLLASFGIYGVLQFQQGKKILEAQERMGGGPNPLEMVARLEKRLQENPNGLQGQIMTGRSYQALNRLEKAREAWEKVLELDPTHNEAHYNLGVVMTKRENSTTQNSSESPFRTSRWC